MSTRRRWKAGWGYRIRLKGNLSLPYEGGEISTGEAVKSCHEGIAGAQLYGSGVRTNIGFLHEKGHKEPWIIAMDAMPTEGRVRDYGMRWGVKTCSQTSKAGALAL